MATELNKELYTPQELAKKIGKSHLYVLRLINEKKIKAHKPFGNNRWAISRAEVARVLGLPNPGSDRGLGNDGPDEHSDSTEIPSGRLGNVETIQVPDHLEKYLEEPSQEPPGMDEEDDDELLAEPVETGGDDDPPADPEDQPLPQKKKRSFLERLVSPPKEETTSADMQHIDADKQKGRAFPLDFDLF